MEVPVSCCGDRKYPKLIKFENAAGTADKAYVDPYEVVGVYDDAGGTIVIHLRGGGSITVGNTLAEVEAALLLYVGFEINSAGVAPSAPIGE